MRILVGILALLLLLGCGGEPKKEEQKTEPQVSEEPSPAPAAEEPKVEKPVPSQPVPSVEKPTAKPSEEKNVTVVGDVIDIVGYTTSGVVPTSASGKEIIEASAKGGNPLGILERTSGQVYLVTMKQANTPATNALLPFVGVTIAAKGDVYRKGDQQLLVMHTVGKSIK
jgi:hypothetical protein